MDPALALSQALCAAAGYVHSIMLVEASVQVFSTFADSAAG